MKILLMRCRVLQNESGYSLVGVLLLIVLISVLGLSLIALTTTSVKTTTSERSDQSAFYIAEAGATLEMAEIEKAVNDVYNAVEQSKKAKETEEEIRNRFYSELNSKILTAGPKTSPANFEEAFGEKPKAEIKVVGVSGAKPGTYKITSTGTIGKKKRTVEQEFSVDWQPKTGGGGGIPDIAAFVEETITMGGSATINGDIGTLRKASGSIIANGNPSVNGDIFVPFGYEKNAISGTNNFPKPTGADLKQLPKLPTFPTFPNLPPAKEYIIELSGGQNKTYQLDDSLKIKKISIKSNLTLSINVGNTDKEIVVETLDVQSGHIKLLGSGKLTIYVTDTIIMGGGSTINDNGSVNRLDVFLKGSQNPNSPKSLILGGSQKIFGSLYSEDANIEFNGGGGFQGNLFTGGKSVEIGGGAATTSPLILAPNATVELYGGGTVTGVVIAKSLLMSGGTSLNYQKMEFTKGPISVEGIELDSEQDGDSGLSVTKKPLQEK